MPETEDFDKTPAHWAGRREALEAAVLAIAVQLPEAAMRAVAEELRRLRDSAEADPRTRDTDPLRDRAAAIWDYVEPFCEAMEQQADELRDGTRLRTIPPAPPLDEQEAGPGPWP